MSQPRIPGASPFGRPAGPRPAVGDGPRVHALAALVASLVLGVSGTVVSWLVGSLVVFVLGEGCSESSLRRLRCSGFLRDFLFAGPGVTALVAVALAVIGLVRARRGSGHVWPALAWLCWSVYAVAWVVLVVLAVR